MIERRGDCQRKFDGLQKWLFRLFFEDLPIMLRIALLLLTCGLSRYMWPVNTFVARVVISFTILCMLLWHRDCCFRDIVLWVFISNVRIDRSSISQRQRDGPAIVGWYVSVQRHLTHLQFSPLAFLPPLTRNWSPRPFQDFPTQSWTDSTSTCSSGHLS